MAVGSNLSILLTRRCNMTCGHCSVESSPHVKAEPTEEELLQRTKGAIASGVQTILFTGGEPMLREKILLRLLRECKQRGVRTAITSNGFWGKKPESADAKLEALRQAGLDLLTISYDRFHAEFQGPAPAVNIARAGEKHNFPVNINITRTADDSELEEITRPFENIPSARLRFYDVQPVGRAQLLDAGTLRRQVEGFCNACHAPSLTDDGRLIACNGPAYFEKPESPLVVGSLRENSMAGLIEKHRDDVILDTIRTFGPVRLQEELKLLPGFEQFARPRYFGMCDLCKHITSDAAAVAALREHLSDSSHTAARLAKLQVIEHGRRKELNRNYVNTTGVHKVLFHAMRQGQWLPETPNVLGRADLDWQETATYLAACGLSRQLMALEKEDSLTRWAPSFFAKKVRENAKHEALRQSIQLATLEKLDEALNAVGTRGVLLKGAAMLALHRQRGEKSSPRAIGDIDIWVTPEHAQKLRDYLLANGFHGDKEGSRTGPHHLAPIRFAMQMVEIHTAIMPSFWGLPEAAMLHAARPLSAYKNIQVLSPEGLAVHGVLHSATHLFGCGVKTAWDLADVLQWFPHLDAMQVARWARNSPLQQTFWAILQVFHQELQLEIPKLLLRQSPRTTRARQLQFIAARRLFGAREGAQELNPLTRNALFLMMAENPRRQLQYMGALLFSPAVREARRTAWETTPEQAPGRWREMLAESYGQWKAFQKNCNAQQIPETNTDFDAP